MYPEYQRDVQGRQVLLTGESYAGKYIPMFAKYIDDYKNAQLKPAFYLKAILIGNPLTSPMTQRIQTHKVT